MGFVWPRETTSSERFKNGQTICAHFFAGWVTVSVYGVLALLSTFLPARMLPLRPGGTVWLAAFVAATLGALAVVIPLAVRLHRLSRDVEEISCNPGRRGWKTARWVALNIGIPWVVLWPIAEIGFDAQEAQEKRPEMARLLGRTAQAYLQWLLVYTVVAVVLLG
jgi:hypothetical protein